ncbi:MAG: hypothetical protein ABJC36_05345 [Gemmatimonadales bacterium]
MSQARARQLVGPAILSAAFTSAVVAGVALAGGCRSAQSAPAPVVDDSCAAGGAALTPRTDARTLAGTYELDLVAATGARAGATAKGHLVLHVIDDSAMAPVHVFGRPDSSLRHPLAGTLELDPASIGAVATGDLGSSDRSAPGALVIERRPATPEAPIAITIRLGAEANRGGPARFDGGYFALTVRRLGPGGFAGTWVSGGAAGEEGGGSFCARRTPR